MAHIRLKRGGGRGAACSDRITSLRTEIITFSDNFTRTSGILERQSQTLGFRRDRTDFFRLVGCYAAKGSAKPTFRDSYRVKGQAVQEEVFWESLTLDDGADL